MTTDTLFAEAINLIHDSKRILVTTHVKPDGDAAGSLGALVQALRAQGKQTHALFLSPVPQWYKFLAPQDISVMDETLSWDHVVDRILEQVDLVILLDVNSLNQLPKIGPWLKEGDLPVLIIDHHATSDHLGSVEVVDHSAAATGVLVYELCKQAGWPITESMAEAMFVAAATDTGWFQFGNADSRVYRDCAALIDAGAKPAKIYETLYQNFSYARFKLTQVMLATLELYFGGQFAIQHIRKLDFEHTGTNHEDTENLINECHRIGSVKASVLLVELDDGRIRCSLRSRGAVDVSQIARRFGGGGHKMASGTFLEGPLEHAKELIISQFKPFFES
jgi:bifunctional oligoribonuclease and PAP phosphatase NrnA